MLSFNALQFIKNLAGFDIDICYAGLRVHIDYDLHTDILKFFTSEISDDPDFKLVHTTTLKSASETYESLFQLFANVLK